MGIRYPVVAAPAPSLELQAFKATINGSGAFQTVNFPVEFSSTPIVDGTMVAGNADATIIVRNETKASFQFRARNNNTGHNIHTGAQKVNFIAVVP